MQSRILGPQLGPCVCRELSQTARRAIPTAARLGGRPSDHARVIRQIPVPAGRGLQAAGGAATGKEPVDGSRAVPFDGLPGWPAGAEGHQTLLQGP
eukprot:10494865-Alexandrium_andersonii.AAC.1